MDLQFLTLSPDPGCAQILRHLENASPVDFWHTCNDPRLLVSWLSAAGYDGWLPPFAANCAELAAREWVAAFPDDPVIPASVARLRRSYGAETLLPAEAEALAAKVASAIDGIDVCAHRAAYTGGHAVYRVLTALARQTNRADMAATAALMLAKAQYPDIAAMLIDGVACEIVRRAWPDPPALASWRLDQPLRRLPADIGNVDLIAAGKAEVAS